MDYESSTAAVLNEVSPVAEIELLAREAAVPRELFAKLYRIERAKLERGAKVTTYVSVLTHRRVKALLREQRLA
jgi:Protein of unknown function (DUF3562)